MTEIDDFDASGWSYVPGTLDANVIDAIAAYSGIDLNEIHLFSSLEDDLGLDDVDLLDLFNETKQHVSFKKTDNPFERWIDHALNDFSNGKQILKYHTVYDWIRKVCLGNPINKLSDGFPRQYL